MFSDNKLEMEATKPPRTVSQPSVQSMHSDVCMARVCPATLNAIEDLNALVRMNELSKC